MPRKNAVAVTQVQEQPARTIENIRADIVKVVTADGSMDITVHNLAVETLDHAANTGDFTLFAQLVGDCKTAGGVVYGRGVRSRRLGLIEWATKFSPIRINGDGLIGSLPKTNKAYVEYNVEAATNTPFYDMKGESDRRSQNKAFDITVMLKRVGSFTNAIKKAEEDGKLESDLEASMQFAREVNAYAAKRARELGLTDEANQAVKRQAPAAEGEEQDKAVA